MKPLGWLLLIAPIVLTTVGYIILPRVIKRTGMREFMGIYSLVLSLLTGVVTGYILIFPIGALVFYFLPNKPFNGHYGMPMGQAFLTIGLTIIAGLAAGIMALVKIARWRKRKQSLADNRDTTLIF
ncbi:hypothetical protein ACFGVR_17750 [Mucilaginibacter sp. AW1-3]